MINMKTAKPILSVKLFEEIILEIFTFCTIQTLVYGKVQFIQTGLQGAPPGALFAWNPVGMEPGN